MASTLTAENRETALPRWQRRRVVSACAGVAIVTGLLVVVVGWALDVAAMRSLIPGTVGMKPSTATMFVLSGIALALVAGAPSRRRRALAAGCALSCIVLSAAFLSEYVLGWDLGIDEFPFRDTAGHAAAIAYPGRLAPTTAACFILMGLALLAIDARRRVVELLAAPVAAIAALCLIGYAYSIPLFYGPAAAAKMAINTALVFLLLAVGVTLVRPRGRLLALLTTRNPGGVMARRLLPLALGVPLVLGWARLVGQDAGLFSERVGTWLLTATTIAALVAIIAGAAVKLSRAEELKNDIVGVIAHDLRSPLQVIKGYAQLLERLGERATPEMRTEALQAIEVSADMMAGLVSDVLDLAQFETTFAYDVPAAPTAAACAKAPGSRGSARATAAA